MRRTKVKFLTIIAIIIVVLAAIIILFLRSVFPSIPKQNDIQDVFEKNRRLFDVVVDSFTTYNEESMGIWRAEGSYNQIKILGINPSQVIEYKDEELYQSITALFDELDCRIIQKKDGYISFQMWSSLDSEVCFVYYPNGEGPRLNSDIPDDKKDEKVARIDYDSWYYYYVQIS